MDDYGKELRLYARVWLAASLCAVAATLALIVIGAYQDANPLTLELGSAPVKNHLFAHFSVAHITAVGGLLVAMGYCSRGYRVARRDLKEWYSASSIKDDARRDEALAKLAQPPPEPEPRKVQRAPGFGTTIL